MNTNVILARDKPAVQPNDEQMARWRRWPRWLGYLAAFWSLIYGALGMYWMRAPGFPFGLEADDKASGSLLSTARPETGAPLIAALGLVGALVAVAMVRTRASGWPRLALLGFAWLCALVLTVVVTDLRVLMTMAYGLVFLVGAPFHWPAANFWDTVSWPVWNQVVCMVGGLLWAGTALAYQRRTAGACLYCGRSADGAGWTTPAAARRWGGWATYLAAAIPLVYVLTRYAWLLGLPLGMTDEALREGQEAGTWVGGAALATVAVGGAILTLGLVQRWGEAFPRWLPGLGGRRVPLWLAVVPATGVSISVTAAGISFFRLFFSVPLTPDTWVAVGPGLLWPLWGLALGAATLAYYLRRRGRCGACGRGE